MGQASLPLSQPVNRAEGLGTAQHSATTTFFNCYSNCYNNNVCIICTMLKVDLMSQRPRGVFIDIEIFYISIG